MKLAQALNFIDPEYAASTHNQVPEDAGRRYWDKIPKPETMAIEDRISRIVAHHPGMTVAALCHEVSIPPSRVRPRLARMESQGRLFLDRNDKLLRIYPGYKRPKPTKSATWTWPVKRSLALTCRRMLKIIRDEPGVTVAEIAAILMLRHSYLMPLVRDLEAWGLVLSTPEHNIKCLSITERGIVALTTPAPTETTLKKPAKEKAKAIPIIDRCGMCPRYAHLKNDKAHGLCRETQKIVNDRDAPCKCATEI